MESPHKRPKIEPPDDDSDNEVQVVSPTKFKQSKNDINDAQNPDDDVMITSSNVTNPNIDYSHIRHHCGVYVFSSGSTSSDNERCCDKCYCYVCDTLAVECGYWTEAKINETKQSNSSADALKLSELGPHCHAYCDKVNGGKWDNLKDFVRKKNHPAVVAANHLQVTNAAAAAAAGSNPYTGTHSAAIRDEILHRLANLTEAASGNNAMANNERIRSRKEMRIPEVLLENFRNAVTLNENANASTASTSDDTKTTQRKTQGDIPTLSPAPTFIEGIQIGFPFAKIMKPQRQIMFHIIRALKNQRHVVIESPTGTGKSAAILCSVLAWQRWHWKREGTKEGEGGSSNRVRIIYCSRTHSQVTQMVASLKSTPYRPRMAILGSRDRLCIHKSIKPRTPGAEPITGINVNNECRLRVRNTEKYRKQKLTNPSSTDPYLDEHPPEDLPGDGSADAMQDGPHEGEEENSFISRSRTCPHYRQLTANRLADLANQTFVPNKKVDCCSVGGKKSKYGSHDIEDLVEFGKDPYLQTGVTLYRGKDSMAYGLRLKNAQKGSGGGCVVESTEQGSPADIVGSLSIGDTILRVNGCDVSKEDVGIVAKKIKESSGDSVTLDVSRGGTGSLSRIDGGYSSHSACPYYISHMLSKDADLVFAPYNYVLDPQIRNAMGLELNNSVVILDEGHNIESTLREAGSGRFGEFELCDLIVMLNNYAITEKSTFNSLEVEGEDDTLYMSDVAHALLLFVEKLAIKLKESRLAFERNPGPKGAGACLREYERFHSPDDTQFEISLHGPTGNGVRGAAVGCLPFFEQLGILQSDLEMLTRYVDAFEKFCRGQDSNETSGERDRISNLTDRLIDLVHKMHSARMKSEHYYAATVAIANGSLDFANGTEVDGNDDGVRRWKKKPRAFPLIAPRTVQNPNRPPNPCLHAICKARSPNVLDPVRHGNSCDGSTPKWEAVLNLELLTPGPLFQELADECRTVVLASGSLAPIPSLCAELNLFSSDTPVALPSTSNPSSPAPQKRLQTQPRPLEADHVVNLDKQLFVTSIGHFTDGSELQVSHKNYSKAEFLEKLGESIVKVVECIPEGGVLVFLPSYALLRKCERLWNPAGSGSNRRAYWSQFEGASNAPSIFDRLRTLKHNVIMEPSGSNQTEFEEKKQEYMESVDRLGGCVLFAVYRGKMSEGISFNDNYARGVICIGVPLPSTYALPIKIKMNYNDEQRKLKHRTDLLPGREWYSQQAYRAIAQALGRCIRHSADYGAIILMDSRHCDDETPNDGIPKAHRNLPSWMRTTVRNLTMNSTPRNSMFTYRSASKTVCGGYGGLRKELEKFFRDAKPFVASVAQSQNARPAGASRPTIQNQQFTPPPGSSRAPLSISSSASSSVIKSVQHIQLSTTSKSSAMSTESNEVVVLNSLPPKKSDNVKVVSSRQNTLMSAFQKQRENEPASKAPKIKSVPSNLKTMFERQLSSQEAAVNSDAPPQSSYTEQNSNPNTQSIEVEAQHTSSQCGGVIASTQDMGVTTSEIQSSLNPTTHSFKRSPFAQFAYSPQNESTLAGKQQIGLASSESDESLCVICEDSKKQVVLLPCKHMCLCKSCADFDKIKECPMCRATVESSMAVFI